MTDPRDVLDYDPNTGDFTWKEDYFDKKYAGEVAGSVSKARPRIDIVVEGKSYLAHRLAYLFMTGKIPDCMVSHHDGDKTHNAWSNLKKRPGAARKCVENKPASLALLSQRWV